MPSHSLHHDKSGPATRFPFAGWLAAIVCGVVIHVLIVNGAAAESPKPPAAVSDNPIAVTGASATVQAEGDKSDAVAAPPGKHPLDPAIDLAKKIKKNIDDNVKDYTCILMRQERFGGKLGAQQVMETKVRHEPFSAYLKFLKPAAFADREVIYIAGANNGNLLAREGSGLKRKLGVLPLKPNGPLAMDENRYPITNIGIQFLAKRLIEVATQDRKYGEAEVHFFNKAKVGDRVCTLVEVVHPAARRNFLYHKARIFIDDELQVPIRYEAYLWPEKPGAEPPLDESYTYVNLKLNVGLTDADFDIKNAKYGFLDK